LFALAGLPAAAAELKFDAANSELGFTGVYGGEPVPGKFKTFSGSVVFDVAKPLATRFTTTIEVASLDTDYSDRDDTLRGTEFFDAEKYPKASYASTGDCTMADGQLSCPGTLTLHGVTQPVALDVTPSADGSSMEGNATLDRSQFGIGTGDWADPESIANNVEIRFKLKLAP
jgi:polyisoprenoid-binding protein YceI